MLCLHNAALLWESVWLNKTMQIWNVILKNNEKVKCFSEINSIMFLCISTINKNNRLIYTTLSICLWVNFYVLQKLCLFSFKIFFVQKNKWFVAILLTLASIFYLSFFSSKHRYVSMHTQNMIIKVHGSLNYLCQDFWIVLYAFCFQALIK